MLSIILMTLGIVIVGGMFLDVVWTTLTLNRSGPWSTALMKGIWFFFRKVYRSLETNWVLPLAGPTMLFFTVLTWFLGHWIGWTLVFYSQEQAVVESQSQQPADIWSRIYFTGYTLSTLGLGDYQPQGNFWKIVTAIVSANGFTLLTLSVSYLLPILAAEVEKRQIAFLISTLGRTTEEIVIKSWNGQDFQPLSQHLTTIVPQIILLNQRWLAYPVLHYFQSGQKETAIEPNVSRLDEALSLIQCGIASKHRIPQAVYDPARQTITEFLKQVEKVYLEPVEKTPATPSLQKMEEKEIPIVDHQEFQESMQNLAERRRLLWGLCRSYGWSWTIVESTE